MVYIVRTFNAIVAANKIHDGVAACLILFRSEDLGNLGKSSV